MPGIVRLPITEAVMGVVEAWPGGSEVYLNSAVVSWCLYINPLEWELWFRESCSDRA